MLKIRLLYFFIGFTFLDCRNDSEKVKSVNSVEDIDSLKIKAILMGDTTAFKELRGAYLDYSPESFIPYAVYFAEKYNYPMAHYEVYLNIGFANGQQLGEYSIEKTGKGNYNLALKHLKLAAEANYYDAKQILSDQLEYSKSLVKDSVRMDL